MEERKKLPRHRGEALKLLAFLVNFLREADWDDGDAQSAANSHNQTMQPTGSSVTTSESGISKHSLDLEHETQRHRTPVQQLSRNRESLRSDAASQASSRRAVSQSSGSSHEFRMHPETPE
jgi:hypothetical protein